MHLGYGLDDPRNQDVGFITTGINDPGQRLYNQVAWANMFWDITESFQLGVEVSHRKTHYLNPLSNDEGVLFHFSSTPNTRRTRSDVSRQEQSHTVAAASTRAVG